jgi:hypothetical protein
MMQKFLVTTAMLTALAAPVQAQNAEAEDGFSLMEEGAKLLLRGLMSEIEPSVDEFQNLMEEFGPTMQGFMVELGPRLDTLLEIVDDFDNYGQPEVLPNGDIIIRRDPNAPPFRLPEDDGEIAGEIEL